MKKSLSLIASLMLFPNQFIPVSKILTTNKSPSLPLSQSPRQSYVATVKKNSINPPPVIAVETQIIASEIEPELKKYAREISVKIDTENNGGSGVIIGKKDNEYLVVTNNHVIQGGKTLTIQTADQKIHQARIVSQPILGDDDIALLTFKSDRLYQVANLNGAATGKESQRILAIGYSAAEGIFKIEKGTIKRIPNQPLKEGYQIGYDSNVVSGMSGGAILNIFGDVIGINGKSAFPILNTGYVYQDGRIPSAEEIEQLRQLSWGLSVNQLLVELKPEIISAYGLPLPVNNTTSNPVLPGWVGELETLAKQITVTINSSSGSNGSGIIVAQENNTYAVLTADHVICEKDRETRKCIDYSYEIVTPDGKKYTLDRKKFKRQEGVDLAVVRFKSKAEYTIAQLADYPVTNNDQVFVAGYPQLNQSHPQWKFGLGYGLDREQGLLKVNDNSLSRDSSGLTSSQNSLAGGYEMVYTSITHGGMSGGAVLDREGRVIGIHGLAEGETAFDSQSSSHKQIQLGYSLGIPVKTFIGIADRFKLESQLSIENRQPRKLTKQEAETFRTAILDTDVAKGNATPEIWLERGNQLWRLKRYTEAIQAFDRAIDLNPDFVYLAYYGKGVALSYRDEYEAALANFEQAAKAQPNYASAFKYKSSMLSKLERFEEALTAINRAVDLEPDNANLYNDKALVLSDLGRYEAGEKTLDRAIKISPRATFYSNRGMFRFNQGKTFITGYSIQDHIANLDTNQDSSNRIQSDSNPNIIIAANSTQEKKKLALEDYNRAIQLNPNHADFYLNRGLLYQSLGQSELALADVNKTLQLNPNNSQAYNNRGLLYQGLGQSELALKDYNQGIQLNSNLFFLYLNRGHLYLTLGKLELALKDFNQLLTLNPDISLGYQNRGIVYFNQGKFDLALADYNKAIELNPNLAVVYLNRGFLYDYKKEFDLALADYNKAIEIDPNLTVVYLNRGLVYKQQKEFDLALADYNKAIELDPNFLLAYLNRASIYVEQKKIDLALADYDKTIELNPNFLLAYFNRSIVYKDQKKLDLALADANRVVEINPNSDISYSIRSEIYLAYFSQERNPKNLELALADASRAIEINPNSDTAYLIRSSIYIAYFFQDRNPENLELALADANKGLPLNQQLVQGYNNRVIIYNQQGKFKQALAEANRAIEINPDHPGVYKLKGDTYFIQGMFDEAISNYNHSLSLDSESPSTINNIGLLKYEMGEIETAKENFEKAVNLDSKSAESLLALAVTLSNLGESEKALSLAEKALNIDQDYADPKYLKYQLWGDKLIADTQQLLSHPQIQALLAEF